VDGRIKAPLQRGNEFKWIGIRRGFELPISAERAVRLAYDATGRPAVAPPVLIAPTAQRMYAQYAHWQIVLGPPSTSSAVRITDDTIFIDYLGRIRLASTRNTMPDAFVLTQADANHSARRTVLHGRSGLARHLLPALEDR
jgi:hypothetical protein